MPPRSHRPHSPDDVRDVPDDPHHPTVVAQKAATMQLLCQGRFRLGLGSGENLNEHVVGGG